MRLVILAVLCGTAAADGIAGFGDYRPATDRTYDGYRVISKYVTMRDGVNLAVDVLLPKGLAADAKIPAVLYQTSFWRSVEVRWPFNHFHEPDPLHVYLANHGYAVVLADVRGTGASFGSRLYPWHEDELKDGGQLVDWVLAQPWSDGRVGAIGMGYEGTTAELLTVSNRPAVKAVIPMYSEFDTYAETAFPGGIFNEWFVRKWSYFTEEMSRNVLPKEVGPVRMFAKGVSPVAGANGRQLLNQAIREHEKNLNLYRLAQGVSARDTVVDAAGSEGSINSFTVFRHRAEVERSGAAIFAWGSWLNGASADSVIRRFLTYGNPVHGVIGPWNKGGTQNASPYASDERPTPSLEAQRAECLRFFDHYLRGLAAEMPKERVLFYYTMGEEKWKRTTVWPPEGGIPQRWYLAGQNGLSPQAPASPDALDSYTVDFDASTGDGNRWHGHLLGAPVHYPDRAEADHHLLTYAGPPLEKDIEITGHPVVTLYVTSTATDGAFFVYLEDVAPDGRVTYLTEGELRALYRKVSDDKAPYTNPTPYHSFEEADAMPLVPGETAELTFGLLPVSAVVRQGHRLQVSIAGHDAGTFARVPAQGNPTVTVARNTVHASWVELPVIHKP